MSGEGQDIAAKGAAGPGHGIDFSSLKGTFGSAKSELDKLAQDLEQRVKDFEAKRAALDAERDKLYSDIEREREQLHKRAYELHLVEQRLQQEHRWVEEQNANTRDSVRINIGSEKIISVPRSTLTLFPDSMLGGMFSGRHKLATDDTGSVPLNRSPKYFDYVLEYLRNGGVLPPLPSDKAEVQRIKEEFDYFLLLEAFGVQRPLFEVFQNGAPVRPRICKPGAGYEGNLVSRTVRDFVMTDVYLAVLYDGRRDSSRMQAIEVWNLKYPETPSFYLQEPVSTIGPRVMSGHDNLIVLTRKNLEVCVSMIGRRNWSEHKIIEVVSDDSWDSITSTKISATHLAVVKGKSTVLVWDRERWELQRQFDVGSLARNFRSPLMRCCWATYEGAVVVLGEDGVASIFTERPVKQPEHRLHAPRNELFKHLLVYDNVLLLVSAKGSRFNTPPGNPLTFCVYDLATCVQTHEFVRDGDLDKDGYMHHYLDYGAMITRDYVAYMDSFDTGKCVWLDLKTGAEKSRSYDVLYNRVTMNRMLANENHLVFMCDDREGGFEDLVFMEAA